MASVVKAETNPLTGRSEILSPTTGLPMIGAESIRKLGTALFEPGKGVTPTVSAGAGCTIGSSGFVTEYGEQVFQVTATAISGTSNYVEINIPTFPAITSSNAAVEFYTDPTQGSPVVLYIGTSGYSKFATRSLAIVTPNTSDPVNHYGLMSFFVSEADWTKNNYTTATGDIAFTQAKLRVTITNGQTRTFKLHSLRLGGARKAGRICVISDDGYASWLRLGVPIMEQYGIKTSCAVIADRVGSSALYGSLEDFQDYVARGHECVAHGPIGGTGNLIANYTTNAERVADVNYHRDYLVANGLTSIAGAKCYVWPQGEYAPTSGDVSLLNAMYAAGYRVARSATVKAAPNLPSVRAYNSKHSKLLLPIIGHNYAGATNTADDATETTNVNSIVTAITASGVARTDVCIMLHKVVEKGAATSGQIEIETDRLRTIAAAIRTQMDSGNLVPSFLSDLVQEI